MHPLPGISSSHKMDISMTSNRSETMQNSSFASFTKYNTWFEFYALGTGCTLALVCCFGVLGNILSTSIFVRPSFRSLSTNIFLAALSVSDASFLTLALPIYCSGPLLLHLPQAVVLKWVYCIATAYLYPLLLVFHCCSSWLLVAVTFERWLAVCKPLLVGNYCTRNKAVLQVGAIFCLAFLLNTPGFWEFGIDYQHLRPVARLRKNRYYRFWSSLSSMVFVYLLPFVTVANFNLRVSMELVRSRRTRAALTRAQLDQQKTTKMLLCVVLTFVCCYSPTFILHAVDAIWPGSLHSKEGNAVSMGNNVLVALNAATTFIFYLYFSSRYRRQMIKTAKRCICQDQLPIEEDQLRRFCSLVQASNSVTFSKRNDIHNRMRAGTWATAALAGTLMQMHAAHQSQSSPELSKTSTRKNHNRAYSMSSPRLNKMVTFSIEMDSSDDGKDIHFV